MRKPEYEKTGMVVENAFCAVKAAGVLDRHSGFLIQANDLRE